ncbi:MAG TPA: DUF6152 family protein [Bryobacteraceae bacterium]|nr:DUF6152 family protein [Bryobacteraceae bacterium]
MRNKIGLITAAALLLAATSLWAHHSPSAEFDMSKRITVSGTLTKVDWINPHITLAMDVKNESGKVESWSFESNPPAWFRRVGVGRADLAKAIGQTVTAEGVRAKDGSAFGYMQKITMPDGTSLELASSIK